MPTACLVRPIGGGSCFGWGWDLILVTVYRNRLQTRLTSTTKFVRFLKGTDLACAWPASVQFRARLESNSMRSQVEVMPPFVYIAPLNLFQSTLPLAGSLKRCKSVNTFPSWDRGGNSTAIGWYAPP